MKSLLLFSFLFINFMCAMEKGWERSCEQQCLWNTVGATSFCCTSYILHQALMRDNYYPSRQERQVGWASVIGGSAYILRRLVGMRALEHEEDSCCLTLLSAYCGCKHSYLLNRLNSAWRGWVSAEKKDQ